MSKKQYKKNPAPTAVRYIRFAETAGKNGVDIYITDSSSGPLEFRDKKQTLNAPVKKFDNKEDYYLWVKTNRVYSYIKNLYDKLVSVERPMFYYVVKMPDKKLLSKYEPIFRLLVPYTFPGHPKSTWAPTNKHIEKEFKNYFKGLIKIDFGNQDYSAVSPETLIKPIDTDNFVIPVKSKNDSNQVQTTAFTSSPSRSLVQFTIEPDTWFRAIIRTNLFRAGEFLRKYSSQEGGHRFQMSRSDFEKFKNKITDPNFIRQVQQVLRGPGSTPQDQQIPIIPKIIEIQPDINVIEGIGDRGHGGEDFNLNIMSTEQEIFPGSENDDDDDFSEKIGPMHFPRAVDFYGMFEEGTFDEEKLTKNGWEGYVIDDEGELVKVAGFIFDNSKQRGDDDPGIGWYMSWVTGEDPDLNESLELIRILNLSGLKK